jgi:hypothetical protein
MTLALAPGCDRRLSRAKLCYPESRVHSLVDRQVTSLICEKLSRAFRPPRGQRPLGCGFGRQTLTPILNGLTPIRYHLLVKAAFTTFRQIRTSVRQNCPVSSQEAISPRSIPVQLVEAYAATGIVRGNQRCWWASPPQGISSRARWVHAVHSMRSRLKKQGSSFQPLMCGRDSHRNVRQLP